MTEAQALGMRMHHFWRKPPVSSGGHFFIQFLHAGMGVGDIIRKEDEAILFLDIEWAEWVSLPDIP